MKIVCFFNCIPINEDTLPINYEMSAPELLFAHFIFHHVLEMSVN